MSKPRIICFDIDGTLTEGNSWLLLTQCLGCSIPKHTQLYEDTISGKVTFGAGERELVGMWRNSGQANKDRVTQIYESAKIRPGVRKLFDFLRDKGFLIYLVSGSSKLFTESIAKRLQPTGFYADAEIVFDSDGIISQIEQGITEQGQIKVKQVAEIAKQNDVAIEDIYFVGDSENDIDVFLATGKGLSVHSSNDYLKEMAYKDFESLDEIEKLFAN